MKIRLNIGDHALTARLLNNQAAQDFASMVPLTLTMNDLFRRGELGDGRGSYPDDLGTLEIGKRQLKLFASRLMSRRPVRPRVLPESGIGVKPVVRMAQN